MLLQWNWFKEMAGTYIVVINFRNCVSHKGVWGHLHTINRSLEYIWGPKSIFLSPLDCFLFLFITPPFNIILMWYYICINKHHRYTYTYTTAKGYSPSYHTDQHNQKSFVKRWASYIPSSIFQPLTIMWRICLHSQLGYSTGEFQVLQLIVLATFGAVD